MNPRIKRVQQYFLIVGIFVMLLGLGMMFLGAENGSVDLGCWLALGGGAFAGIPGFYFASQVGFGEQQSNKPDCLPEQQEPHK